MNTQKKQPPVFWLAAAAAVISLITVLISIFEPSIYGGPIAAGTLTEQNRIGAIAQDLITIPLALGYMLLLWRYARAGGVKELIALVGGLGYFLYAFALYSIEAYYTILYPVYLLIFALCFWGLLYGFLQLKPVLARGSEMPRSTRLSVATFLLIVLAVLVPAWLLLMLPLVAAHTPQNAYAVFLLDLTIEFPALAIAAVGLLRRKAWAGPLSGIMLVKEFTVCISWNFGEVFALTALRSTDASLAYISGTLTLVSVVLLVLYFRGLKVPAAAPVHAGE